MRCAKEILVERENKLNEFIIAKKLSLTESTIKFCEEYVGPILEEKFSDLSKDPKRGIYIFSADYANINNYYNKLVYYDYKNYSFDYDIFKAYLDNKCFKTSIRTLSKNKIDISVTIDPKCFKVE